MELYSKQYQKLIQQMHKEQDWGINGARFIPEFVEHYRKLDCKTLLDYGCGRASVQRVIEALRSDIQVRSYDPGIMKYAAMPEPADFILCTDVLEHVEIYCIDDVLKHIYMLMLKGGFINIATVPAKKILPDGQNAHILVRNTDWWLNKLWAYHWQLESVDSTTKTLTVYLRK